jgi:myo-inositol 2-dehydrogenase/D-chiro-inositol 1-dehydrogenase
VTRVAVIGAGRMGSVHARNAAANPRMRLAGIADPDAARAAPLAARLGCPALATEEVLRSRDIDAVVVASSTDTHLDITLAALAAGKAVFCEKPLDLDLARLRAAAGRFSAPAARVFVGFNRRFDEHYRALKARIDDGAIGKLETLHIVNHDPAAPPLDFVPRSGGLFRDFTIHDFDMAAWLLGEEIVELFAWASCLVDPRIAQLGDVDTAKVLLRTGSGRICAISNTRRSGCGYDQRVEAFGSNGAARVENVTQTSAVVWDASGMHSDAIPGSFVERYASAYRAELDHFADVVEGKAAPAAGYAENVRALCLAAGAAESARSGAMVRLTTRKEGK